jgi:hypothetical protein
MGTIKIGWAEESLVPDQKVSLGGQFFERISQYVESEITATAMAVECDGDVAIIVSADVIALSEEGLALIRKNFAASTDEVAPEKIIVGATHTHTSLRLAVPGTTRKASPRAIVEELMPEGMKYEVLVERSTDVMSDEDALYFAAEKVAKAARVFKEDNKYFVEQREKKRPHYPNN